MMEEGLALLPRSKKAGVLTRQQGPIGLIPVSDVGDSAAV